MRIPPETLARPVRDVPPVMAAADPVNLRHTIAHLDGMIACRIAALAADECQHRKHIEDALASDQVAVMILRRYAP